MNTKLVISGIVVLALGIGSYFWIFHKDTSPETSPKQLAAINNAIPTAAGLNQNNLTAFAAKKDVPPLPPATPPQPVAQAEVDDPDKRIELPPEEVAKIRQQLKTEIETNFRDQITFPITEDLMIAYARASVKVRRLNDKWDVQIAGADTDPMAIEYNNMAVEEISKSLQTNKSLTVEQYNAMTKLTATNNDFNRIYQVYKQLIEERYIPLKDPNDLSVPASPTPVTNTVPTPAQPAAPIASAVKTQQPVVAAPVTPAAAPVNRGTAPATQGLPTPPYSSPGLR